MIFNSKILPAQNNITNSSNRVKAGRKSKNDMRKRKYDRRSGVRDGIIVNLSSNSNRRRGMDRRRVQA